MSLKQWQGGMTGKDLEACDDDFGAGRADASWPVDSDGAKLSLPPSYADTMRHAGEGDILVMKNGEMIDPPRKDGVGKRAQKRWDRLVEHTKKGTYPVMNQEEIEARGGKKKSKTTAQDRADQEEQLRNQGDI